MLSIMTPLVSLWLLVAGLSLMIFAAEARSPRGPQPCWRDRRRAALFTAIYAPMPWVGAFLVAPIHITPLFPLTGILGAWLGFFAFDFFNYWLHRAQHKFSLLWRFHAMHHSIEAMGAPTGYRHVTEPIFNAFCCGIPATFIFGPTGAATVTTIAMIQGLYVHSATGLHLGRFNRFIGDNHYHRIHHSREAAHQNKNFAVFLPVWDIMFKTAYFPKPDEWPDIGLDNQREPRTIGDFLLDPFRPQSGLSFQGAKPEHR